MSSIPLRHLFVHPSKSIGMANADTEGTMWWVWSQCRAYQSGQSLTHIAAPNGFDVSQMPFFNMVDLSRILLARVNDCSFTSITTIFTLFPWVALVTTALAAYVLGFKLFKSKSLALFVCISSSFSSQVLLATRTSLSNNFLAPGMLALIFTVVYLESKSKRALVGIFASICFQVLCNVYNGALFAFISVIFLLFLPKYVNDRSINRFLASIGVCFSAVLGLAPLIRSQFFLLSDTAETNAFRPVDQFGETVNPLVLISRNYSWFDQIMPENFPRPEAGWLSIIHIAIFFLAVWFLLTRRRWNAESIRTVFVSICAGLFLIVLVYRLPGTDFVRSAYFRSFSTLRGVSNFSKGIPLLFGIAGASIVQGVINKMASSARHTKLKLSYTANVIVFFSISMLLLDNIPRAESFYTRSSLKPLVQFWSQLPEDRTGTTAHFPDFTYGSEWGFPQRYMQLAQMVMNHRVANGRDYKNRADICSALPTPQNPESLKILTNRGVSRIILHRKLMVQSDFDSATSYLRGLGLSGVSYKLGESSSNLPYLNSLDILVFSLSPGLQTSSSCEK
jgi:hypothetical protein